MRRQQLPRCDECAKHQHCASKRIRYLAPAGQTRAGVCDSARAWPAAQRIAANLELGNAHEALACLVCHSDYVAQAERGKRFQLSDGVGCEACHGGAEHWLGTHVSGKARHAENVALGLKPIGDPQQRAALCMACHSGDARHEMTHKIMGAGHSRFAFELDTFSEIQPAHYVVDADYRERKPTADHATVWALGQIVANRLLLRQLRDGKHLGQGLFPEFIYFNCHSCHRSMLEPSYVEMGTGAGPGGLSAAARAAEMDASRVLLEGSAQIAKTIFQYQKGKHVMCEPSIILLRSSIDFAAGKRDYHGGHRARSDLTVYPFVLNRCSAGDAGYHEQTRENDRLQLRINQ